MDDLLSLCRAAPSSLLDRFGRGNCGFGSLETRSFIRFARRRVAGHRRLCDLPDLARAPLARVVTTTADWFGAAQDRARKSAFIAQIPPASVSSRHCPTSLTSPCVRNCNHFTMC